MKIELPYLKFKLNDTDIEINVKDVLSTLLLMAMLVLAYNIGQNDSMQYQAYFEDICANNGVPMKVTIGNKVYEIDPAYPSNAYLPIR